MPQSSVDMVVARNLKEILEARGKSPCAVAKALGHAPNWLYRIINGDAGILIPTLREIAAELDLSPSILVDPPREKRPQDAHRPTTGGTEAAPSPAATQNKEGPDKPPQPSRTSQWMKVQGHSMSPTLPDGCFVLVDHSSRELEHDGIYLIETHGKPSVRRVRKNGNNGWAILNSETGTETTPIGSNSRVTGQVRQAPLEL